MDISAYLNGILVCPLCRGELLSLPSGARKCPACVREYPVLNGVMDFRLPERTESPPAFYADPEYVKGRARMAEQHELHYDRGSLSGRLEDYFKRELMKIVRDSGRPFFDIGCGTGTGFERLGYPKPIIGVDISMDLLKTCKARYPEAECICCDITRAPFRDGSVDTVFSLATLEHVFYLESFVRAIEKLLSPSGRLYVLIPTEGGFLWSLMRNLAQLKYSGALDFDYKRFFELEHCNKAVTIENVLHKFFVIELARRVPFRFGGNNVNLLVLFRLKKRSAA